MYTKGDKTLSPESALDTAQAIGLTVEEWANKYGWSLSEGKTTVPGDMTPPTDSTNGTRKEDGRWGFQFGRYFFGVTRS